MFSKSLKASLLFRTSANTFSRSMFKKYKRWKNFNFLTKIMDYPQFFGCLKPMFWLFTRACLLFKTSKNRFCTIYFDDLWHGNTRGYKELQVVTRGYKGWQGVIMGYRGLQGVTSSYKRWERVTRGYRLLQGNTEGYKGL